MKAAAHLCTLLTIAYTAGCTAAESEQEIDTEHYRRTVDHSVPEVFTGAIMTPAGPVEVEYEVIDDNAILEGDIVVPWSDFIDLHSPRAATVLRNATWPRGVVPFVIDASLPSPQRVTDAITHWHQRTAIRFVTRTTETDFVRIVDGSGCSSYVGRIGGQQNITLNAACSTGNAIHELGHAIGLWHEQSRQDRDSRVIINWNNIQQGREHNFNKYASGMDIGLYDFDSIMHYSSFAFSANGQPTITKLDGSLISGQRNGLSKGDLFGAELLYGPALPSMRDHDVKFDLNGDGRADLCGRGSAGIYCALSSGAGFGAVTLWVANFRLSTRFSGWRGRADRVVGRAAGRSTASAG